MRKCARCFLILPRLSRVQLAPRDIAYAKFGVNCVSKLLVLQQLVGHVFELEPSGFSAKVNVPQQDNSDDLIVGV